MQLQIQGYIMLLLSYNFASLCTSAQVLSKPTKRHPAMPKLTPHFETPSTQTFTIDLTFPISLLGSLPNSTKSALNPTLIAPRSSIPNTEAGTEVAACKAWLGVNPAATIILSSSCRDSPKGGLAGTKALSLLSVPTAVGMPASRRDFVPCATLS